MEFMFVTMEVSKLSGWLNDDALCRGSKGAYAVGGKESEQAGGGGKPRRTQRARDSSTADSGQGTGQSAP